MKTDIELNDPIFDTKKVRDAGRRAVMKGARNHQASTRDKMEKGPQTGRQYARRRGEGFRRFHRASARGERPAIDSGKLRQNIDVRRTGELSFDVVADTEYSVPLQEGLGRPIMTEQDADEAAEDLARIYAEELQR